MNQWIMNHLSPCIFEVNEMGNKEFSWSGLSKASSRERVSMERGWNYWVVHIKFIFSKLISKQYYVIGSGEFFLGTLWT